jgi:diguanylate cyclase (GGDEF)-like protein
MADIDYPIPDYEVQRLDSVRAYEILDTPPEVEFDALTRLASHTFNTPAAVVGLMDSDRVWFKSQLGLGVPQLDRQIAFCAHAIMQPDQALIVEDLQTDPRFSSNPLVTLAPHLRFYAGIPIVNSAGHALGTFAVVDSKPRNFCEAQRNAMHDFSTLAMTALESRRRELRLGRLATTDYLTGLANRAEFERAIHAEMARSNRSMAPFALLFMDLDGFKVVNDRLGHAAGDEVLREVARRLAEQVRTEEVLARLGGDEFGLVMRLGNGESPEALVMRIHEAVMTPILLSTGNAVSVGISAGFAVYKGASLTASDLLEQADQALYQAKRLLGLRRNKAPRFPNHGKPEPTLSDFAAL